MVRHQVQQQLRARLTRWRRNLQVIQLATLVPTFDPSKDDLEQYVQKIEMLSDIWPADKLNELATRLVLNANGAAFQKLQLQKSEIMTNSKAGIQKLVSILGGQWGKVGLERKYESVEKALFRCIQKNDESNDSFLARSDIYWTELLSKRPLWKRFAPTWSWEGLSCLRMIKSESFLRVTPQVQENLTWPRWANLWEC